MKHRIVSWLFALLVSLSFVLVTPVLTEQASGPLPVCFEDFVNRFTLLLGPVYEVFWDRPKNPVVKTEFSLGKTDAQGRTPFTIQGFLPNGEGLLVEGFLADDKLLSFETTIDQSSSHHIAFPLSFALLPMELFGTDIRAKDLPKFARAMLVWQEESLPSGLQEYDPETWGIEKMYPGNVVMELGWPEALPPSLNGYKLKRTESEAANTYTYSASLVLSPQPGMLASEQAPPIEKPVDDWMPLSEEDLAYFTLSNATAEQVGKWDQVWLRFVANGQPCRMLTYYGGDGVLYDYFNNRKAFLVPGFDPAHRGTIGASWVGPEAPFTEFPQNDQVQYCLDSFPEGTVIRWLMEGNVDTAWYSNRFTERDANDYDSLRDFYLRAFPAGNRLPRSSAIPEDHPLSAISRTHDGETRGDLNQMGIFSLWYETISKPQTQHEVLFFVREDGATAYDLFSGEWLYTRGETPTQCQYNEAFLESLRAASRPRFNRDSLPSILSFQGALETGRRHNEANNNTSNVQQYGPYYEQAKTVGDLRRIYEMLPMGKWYIAPKAEASSPAAFVPGKASVHAVGNETELRQAFELAKKGDSIVLLNDISVYSSIDLEKKQLTLMGVEGHQPTLRLYDSMSSYYGVFPETLINMTGSALAVRNLRIITNRIDNGFKMYKASKLLLGEDVLIEGCGEVVTMWEQSSLTIDGARITDSNGISALDSSKVHMKAGAIDNNHADFMSILVDGSSEFLMEGGSIHHNGLSDTNPPEAVIHVRGSKMTLKGGSIYGNNSISSGAILLEESLLVLEGGEIRDNIGLTAGGIHASNTRIQMKDGLIANNCAYEDGNNVVLDAWEKSSFDMRGGSIEQSSQVYSISRLPSIRLRGKGTTFTYSGGDLKVAELWAEDGAKFVNKVKK